MDGGTQSTFNVYTPEYEDTAVSFSPRTRHW